MIGINRQKLDLTDLCNHLKWVILMRLLALSTFVEVMQVVHLV